MSLLLQTSNLHYHLLELSILCRLSCYQWGFWSSMRLAFCLYCFKLLHGFSETFTIFGNSKRCIPHSRRWIFPHVTRMSPGLHKLFAPWGDALWLLHKSSLQFSAEPPTNCVYIWILVYADMATAMISLTLSIAEHFVYSRWGASFTTENRNRFLDVRFYFYYHFPTSQGSPCLDAATLCCYFTISISVRLIQQQLYETPWQHLPIIW